MKSVLCWAELVWSWALSKMQRVRLELGLRGPVDPRSTTRWVAAFAAGVESSLQIRELCSEQYTVIAVGEAVRRADRVMAGAAGSNLLLDNYSTLQAAVVQLNYLTLLPSYRSTPVFRLLLACLSLIIWYLHSVHPRMSHTVISIL